MSGCLFKRLQRFLVGSVRLGPQFPGENAKIILWQGQPFAPFEGGFWDVLAPSRRNS
jgi:hypothetical protein